METVVFILEGLIYRKLLGRYAAHPDKKIHPWLYAFTANTLSLVTGMLIARWLPGIF